MSVKFGDEEFIIETMVPMNSDKHPRIQRNEEDV